MAAGRARSAPSCPRAGTGAVRAHPELFAEATALRLELPSRSAAQIARILAARHGITVAEQTTRDQLRRRGLHREAVAAEGTAFGRYEASRPNERWITDVQSVVVEALFEPLLVALLQFSAVQFSSVRPLPRRADHPGPGMAEDQGDGIPEVGTGARLVGVATVEADRRDFVGSQPEVRFGRSACREWPAVRSGRRGAKPARLPPWRSGRP